jgi:hypothetical protein
MSTADRHELTPEPEREAHPDDAVRAAVRRAVGEIEGEAQRIAIETRLEIQEKTKRWVAAAGGFLVLALSLLAFFGYREAADFRNELRALEEDARQQITDTRTLVGDRADALNQRITRLSGDVDAAAASVSQRIQEARATLDAEAARFSARLQELDAAAERLQESRNLLAQTRRLRTDYTQAQGQVNEQLQQIARLQNSFFDIGVIYDGPPERREDVLSGLRASLDPFGFVLKPENVFNSTVDRTEILYYDETRPLQVDRLLGLVRASLAGAQSRARGEPVEARFVSERNPRELLIKLRVR